MFTLVILSHNMFSFCSPLIVPNISLDTLGRFNFSFCILLNAFNVSVLRFGRNRSDKSSWIAFTSSDSVSRRLCCITVKFLSLLTESEHRLQQFVSNGDKCLALTFPNIVSSSKFLWSFWSEKVFTLRLGQSMRKLISDTGVLR